MPCSNSNNDNASNDDMDKTTTASCGGDNNDDDGGEWEFAEKTPSCGVNEDIFSLDDSSAPWNAYRAVACPSRPRVNTDSSNILAMEDSHYTLCSSDSQPGQPREYQWPANSPPAANDEWALVPRAYHHHHGMAARTTTTPTTMNPHPTHMAAFTTSTTTVFPSPAAVFMTVLSPPQTIHRGLPINERNCSSGSSSPASSGGEGEGSSSAPSSRGSSSSGAAPRRSDVNDTILRQGPCTTRFELPCEFAGCGRAFDSEHEAVEWREHADGHLREEFPWRVKCCTWMIPLPPPPPFFVSPPPPKEEDDKNHE